MNHIEQLNENLETGLVDDNHTKNIYEKINLIMSEIKSLKKDGRVEFKTTRYNFLSEAKTTEIFHELFVKYKIILVPIGLTEEKVGVITQGKYTYRMFNCEKPSEFLDLVTSGQGQDSGDKGSGKASSYAYKYLLWRTFAIPSNDDPDNICNEELRDLEKKEESKKEEARKAKLEKDNKLITIDKQNKLLDLIIATNSEASAMLSKFKVKDVNELTESQFQIAIKNYESKLMKMKEAQNE